MKTTKLLIVALVLFPLSLLARNPYYPQEFQEQFADVSRVDLNDGQIKHMVFEVLSRSHQKNSGSPDTLGCSGSNGCYSHKSLGYKTARKELFGNMHLKEDNNGYFIEDVYCQKKITKMDTKIGPGVIPNNNVLNAEHTWPQSRFSRQFNNELQKSDLHHLYPTDSRANSKRGNFEFADVGGKGISEDCNDSKFGRADDGQGSRDRFEPPREHKGNVARSLFYFSVRYKISLSPSEEAYLREWHQIDPVDDEEMRRNDEVHDLQGNRNPFLDYPELVDLISKF